MIDSPLTALISKRTRSLEHYDKPLYSDSFVRDTAQWPSPPPSLRTALKRTTSQPLRVLAEIKKKSPSLGELTTKSATEICSDYLQAGVAAISVLVDSPNFGGSPSDLHLCTQKHPQVPFLFKDFVTTPYQVYLARAIGASSILLMTQVLNANELTDLYNLALTIGLEPFVETHNHSQMQTALSLSPPLIGINSRDFMTPTMPIDLGTAPTILEQLCAESVDWPETSALVAQSGITCAEDIQLLDTSCPNGLPSAIQIGATLSQNGAIPTWLQPWLQS